MRHKTRVRQHGKHAPRCVVAWSNPGSASECSRTRSCVPVKYLSCLLTGLEMKVHLVPLTQPHWPQLPLLQKQVRSPLPTLLGLSQPLPLSSSSAASDRGLRTTW